MECLIFKCKEEISSRGLCAKHYVIASTRVKKGVTSWDELIRLGMAKDRRTPKDKGEALISFETHLANARVNGAEWAENHKND